MKRNQSSLLSDIAFLVFLILCFICIVFTASDPNRYLQNLILINIAFSLSIITYFTNLTVGLILNIVFIFIYSSVMLYQTVAHGEAVDVHTYFWIVMSPLFSIIVWMYSFANRQLQEEKKQLQKQNSILATLDENTNLKNIRSFNKDSSIFIGISTRYNIPLTLIVLKVKYWEEIKRLIPSEQMTEIIYDVSRISQSQIRTNDTLYLLEMEKATWGLLLFTDRDGANNVMERINRNLSSSNHTEFAEKYKVELALKMGAVEYEQETMKTPFDFIEQAKKQLEYDV